MLATELQLHKMDSRHFCKELYFFHLFHFLWLWSFVVWDVVERIQKRCICVIRFSQFHWVELLMKSAFLQTMWFWGWIRSREQNSVPECGFATLQSVKVIKMPNLSIELLSYSTIASHFIVAKWTAQLSVLRLAKCWEKIIPMHPALCLKLIAFNFK